MSGDVFQERSVEAWQTKELMHHKFNAEYCANDETVCQGIG